MLKFLKFFKFFLVIKINSYAVIIALLTPKIDFAL